LSLVDLNLIKEYFLIRKDEEKLVFNDLERSILENLSEISINEKNMEKWVGKNNMQQGTKQESNIAAQIFTSVFLGIILLIGFVIYQNFLKMMKEEQKSIYKKNN
jgi:hypothetical protein